MGLVLGCASAMCACASEAGISTAAVRDSAGVEIVESAQPAWSEDRAWVVASEPVLDLTTSGDGAAHEFYQVQDALREGDGTITVALPTEIRFYSELGAYLGSVGREGEGPGEFGRLRHLALLQPDSLAAFDYWQRRVTVYDSDRNVARVMRIDAEYLSGEGFGVLDGRFVFMASWPSVLVADAPWGLVRTPVPIMSVSRTGEVLDTLAVAAGYESVRIPRGEGVIDAVGVFGRQSHVGFLPDGLVVGDAVDLEYRVVNSHGELDRIVRGSKNLELTAEMVDAEFLARYGSDPTAAQRQRISELPVPDRRPAYLDLQVDATGSVWLAEHRGRAAHAYSTAPYSWEVFDEEGTWLGQVLVPGRFTVFEIGVDYVLGVFRDDLDVEHVQVLRLRRGT